LREDVFAATKQLPVKERKRLFSFCATSRPGYWIALFTKRQRQIRRTKYAGCAAAFLISDVYLPVRRAAFRFYCEFVRQRMFPVSLLRCLKGLW